MPNHWKSIPIGKAVMQKDGSDITIATLGVGVHRALEAARLLEQQGVSVGVLDLRSVSPLDWVALCEQVGNTHRLLVVDEDYEAFGLSGELAAVVLEAGIDFKYARVCTRSTIPYAREMEDETFPNVERIVDACTRLMEEKV